MSDGSADEEKLIDAKLEEVDHLLDELQERRKELQEAKEAIVSQRKKRTTAAAPLKGPSEGATALPRPDAHLQEVLQSVEWKSFKKKDGEWAFLRDREGRLREELESVTEFVDQLRKSGKGAVVGKYRYTISEDRFLNRFPTSD